MQNPVILNIKQLAERLNTPVPTLRNWIKTGKCPVPHIEGMKPRKWRVSDVNEFLNAKTVAGAKAEDAGR